jgi:hypothetical protein
MPLSSKPQTQRSTPPLKKLEVGTWVEEILHAKGGGSDPPAKPLEGARPHPPSWWSIRKNFHWIILKSIFYLAFRTEILRWRIGPPSFAFAFGGPPTSRSSKPWWFRPYPSPSYFRWAGHQSLGAAQRPAAADRAPSRRRPMLRE